MDKKEISSRRGGHVLAVPYPSQGHINPMLQFCKRLVFKGLKATLATTVFISRTTKPKSDLHVQIETISDGFDDLGVAGAASDLSYLAHLETTGSKTLVELIERYQNSDHPFDCVVYDSFLPWALDVSKQFGLFTASFFTQACAVNSVYYHVHNGLVKLPISETDKVLIGGLPELRRQDMPGFISVPGSYAAYFDLLLNQFFNVEKADCILVNTYYELEPEVVDWLSSKISPLSMTIGPTIPSKYLDNRLDNDDDYGFHLYDFDATPCVHWLTTKPKASVVYVSFGSMASLGSEQMEELAWGLKNSSYNFLWVVRSSEESKIPVNFADGTSDKGLLVKWSPQLEVLANEAVGCFFTHCGWNSTIEALSLGVPMIGMPQWTDQPMNAKLIDYIWKVGKQVKVNEERSIVTREEIETSIREVMEGEQGTKMKENSKMWMKLAKEAVDEGGTSDINFSEFVSRIQARQSPPIKAKE